MPAARTTSALIKNAIEAFQATGLAVGSVRVGKNGVVEIVAANDRDSLASPKGGKSCDNVFGVQSD